MMKIQLKSKTKQTFIVSKDEELWGILPAKILRFFSLHPNSENNINQPDWNKLQDEIEKYAWNKLLNYLAYRERSSKECYSYLYRLPLHAEIISKLLHKAAENNFLDDKRFAEIYVGDLVEKSKSKFEIKNKLIVKGIGPEIIEAALKQYFSPTLENEILESNLEKAWRRYSSLPETIREEKILNYLTRKGFSYWQVKEKISEKGNEDE